MFAKKKVEKTPQEKLAEVNERIAYLDDLYERGGRDYHSPDDARVRESLVNLAAAIEGEIETEKNKPPKEPSMWSRMMRR